MKSYFSQKDISFLYNLKPIGVGTKMCESLTSYITRLSGAHYIPNKTLIQYIFTNAKEVTNKGINFGTRFLREEGKSINGVGIYAQEISSILKNLTKVQGLEKLTMLPLKNILDTMGKGLLKNKKVWCDLCFRDQGKIRRYEPLIWAIRNVDFCPIHCTNFDSTCPNCKSLQPFLTSFTKIGECYKCGIDLSKYAQSANKTKITDPKKIWYTEKICYLIEQAESLMEKGNYTQFTIAIQNAVDHFARGNTRKMDRLLGFGNGTIGQWRNGRHRPTLSTLIEFLYLIQADPIDFLCNRKFEFNGILKEKSPAKIRRNNHNTRIDHAAIEKELKQIIKSKDFSISLNSTKKKLSVSSGYLRNRFPMEVKIIINRYRYFRKKIYKTKRSYQKDMIRFAVHDLKTSGIYPSKRKVFNEKYGLRESYILALELKETWRNELRNAGFDI